MKTTANYYEFLKMYEGPLNVAKDFIRMYKHIKIFGPRTIVYNPKTDRISIRNGHVSI